MLLLFGENHSYVFGTFFRVAIGRASGRDVSIRHWLYLSLYVVASAVARIAVVNLAVNMAGIR